MKIKHFDTKNRRELPHLATIFAYLTYTCETEERIMIYILTFSHQSIISVNACVYSCACELESVLHFLGEEENLEIMINLNYETYI